jgi:hypothetical protein
MSWKEIKSQSDADHLMDLFGGFHDACLREAHLWTDHWVGPTLSMSCPGHLDNRLRLLVQRQFKDPSAIELLFEELTRFNLVPSPENYDAVIFEATLLVKDENIYWSCRDNWKPDSPTRDSGTWVSARRLCWRPVDWLGRELRYGPKEEGWNGTTG